VLHALLQRTLHIINIFAEKRSRRDFSVLINKRALKVIWFLQRVLIDQGAAQPEIFDFSWKIRIFNFFWKIRFFLKGDPFGDHSPKNFFAKTAYIGVKSCKKLIARTPKIWKRLLDPDSGNGVGVLKRKSNIFGFYEKTVDS
jgi:hypothetical protein